MVNRINGNLAREAILAAIKDQAATAKDIRSDAQDMFKAAMDTGSTMETSRVNATKAPSPASMLGDGLMSVNRELKGVEPDQMVKDLLSGEIESIHQAAAKINKAKLSFDFAMEVRNKLIEAYRETMRMGI